MFLAEGYLTEYLNTRSNFTAYDKIFRPSGELSQNTFYQSPLTEAPQMKHAAKQDRRKASQPIVDVSEYSDEKFDSILNISDDMPLDNIVEKLNENSE